MKKIWINQGLFLNKKQEIHIKKIRRKSSFLTKKKFVT